MAESTMTDLKFELLSILYNNKFQSERTVNLLNTIHKNPLTITKALNDLQSDKLIVKINGDNSYKITTKGSSAYEQELIYRENNTAELKHRAFDRKYLILATIFSGISALAAVIGIILSIIFR